ncbi:MAG: hypothetical protein ACYTHJ_01735 [Planctomycetota bacterium]|jgi:hypothetical protein
MALVSALLSQGVGTAEEPAKPAPARPEVLANIAADWRFERIDFPLHFAPGLKYKGFEELRFAPGMFNATSDTYFTYIFAMKVAGRAFADTEELSALFNAYYKGLCKEVAEATEFEVEISKVAAAVKEDHFEARDARHFSVTLESYDPFVTGRPLVLYLEVIVMNRGESESELFAVASPKKTDTAVWTVLREFKKAYLASKNAEAAGAKLE